jgi:cytidylate kinase
MIVAIDGPAGAGKSSVALEAARRLGFQYVDTGAIYRAVTFESRERDLSWTDGAAIAALASRMDISFRFDGDTNHVLVAVGNDPVRDITGSIRTPEISQGTSMVSAIPEVRAALLDLQRRLGALADCVLEGRDIGTVVFPSAEVKIFLTASVAERARRRWQQWLDGADDASDVPTVDDIAEQIRERDGRDSAREAAPLVAADDATTLDTTTLSFDEVVDAIERAVISRR